MKPKLLPCLAFLFLFACKKNTTEDTTILPVEPEIENTTFTVFRVNSEIGRFNPIANSRTYLLGYGYDVDGRYADSTSARYQVIDMRKFETRYPGYVVIGNMFQSSSPKMIVAHNAGAFSEQVSKQNKATRLFRTFRKSLTTLGDSSALSQKYIYASAVYQIYIKKATMYLPPVDSMKQYLSTAFTTDAETMTPANLVEKYGTHVLTDIELGSKLEVIYQAESKRTDPVEREQKALIGLTRATAAVFKLNTGYFSSGPAYINSNTNQRIFYKSFGGDPATLPQLPADNTVNPQINFIDWSKSSTLDNCSLIDINESGLAPLSDFIFDAAKKAAVKAYIDSYIAINTVKVTQ